MTDLETAAIAWWQSKRPSDFTEEEHLQRPSINCQSMQEDVLAVEVAAVVQANR